MGQKRQEILDRQETKKLRRKRKRRRKKIMKVQMPRILKRKRKKIKQKRSAGNGKARIIKVTTYNAENIQQNVFEPAKLLK